MSKYPRPREKSTANKKYSKVMNEFSYIYPNNYDGELYSIEEETKRVRINPIPILVRFRHKGSKEEQKAKINNLLLVVNRDLKKSYFKVKHGDVFTINKYFPAIATLLGIKHGVKKLREKEGLD